MSPDIRHLTIARRVRFALRGKAHAGTTQIWFGLHGYNQLAHRFVSHLGCLDDERRLLVAPEGLHRHYIDHAARKVGASWMTSEDRLTDIEDYVAYLDRLYDHVLAEGEVDRANVRVCGLGFSQGVHTLSRWVAYGAARLDRIVLWGATLPPDLDLAANREAFAGPDLILVVGDRDEFYGAESVRAQEQRLAEAGIPFTTRRFAGGHVLDDEVLRELAARPFGP